MDTQRRLALLCAALLLSPLAATPAHAAEPDPVLTGMVVDQDGRSSPGALVSVQNDPAVTGFFALVTCLNPLAFFTPGVCSPRTASVRTDATGHYRLRLRAGTPLAGAGVRHLIVTDRSDPAGTFRGDLVLRPGRQDLPAVTLWTRPASVTTAAGQTRITLSRPPGASGEPVVGFVATDPPNPDMLPEKAYEARADSNGIAIVDARVLEDGTRSLGGGWPGTWNDRKAFWTSRRTSVTAVGRPASRGVGCATYARGGALVALPSCPFTDGLLGTRLGLTKADALERSVQACVNSGDCPSPHTLVFDLGNPRLLQAVIWRGCSSCTLEVSADGGTWTTWATRQQGTGDATLTGPPVPVRAVRVRGGAFLTWDLREVSVWSDPLLPLG